MDSGLANLNIVAFTGGDLTCYIPNLVELEQLENIARLLAEVSAAMSFTVAKAMVETYHRARSVGLEKVRLGNIGVFARTEEDQRFLLENLDNEAF